MNKVLRTAVFILVVCPLTLSLQGFWHEIQAQDSSNLNAADSVSELKSRALEGDADAQIKMGDLHYYGEGVSQQYAEAVKWYSMAAEQGNPSAQLTLGRIYYNGEGVPVDLAEAFKWYKKAAEQGDIDGQGAIGDIYLYGYGVTPSPAEALKWYRLAAGQGGSNAMTQIGSMYERGEGVEPNQAEAIKWYKMAAGQGNDFAQSRLDVLEPAGGTPQGMSGQICQGYSFVIPQAIIFRGQGLPIDIALQLTDSSYDLSPRLFDFLNYMVKTAYEDPGAATEMLRSGKFLELCTQHVQGF